MGRFGSVTTAVGVAGLRDLTPADLPAVVDYWTKSPDEFLVFMGVDRARLGSVADIHKRLFVAIRTSEPTQRSIALAITVDERLIGYTLLNRYGEEENYSHWHIIVPGLRSKGISTALYAVRVKAYFDMAAISRLIHQTRTRNVAVNRMLDKFVPIAETKHVDNPDGVALPGEFHIRYVRREDISTIFERTAELGINRAVWS
jgi:RimJ/RimL family protein N-acetyltransferase